MTSPSETSEGIILAVRPGFATVRVDAGGGCPRCAAGRGCGAGIFAGQGPKDFEVALPPDCAPRVGEPICFSLQPERLLHAAWLAYGVPLAALFTAALIGGFLVPGGASDAQAVGLAGAGVLVAGWWARRRLRRAGTLDCFVPSLGTAISRRMAAEHRGGP